MAPLHCYDHASGELVKKKEKKEKKSKIKKEKKSRESDHTRKDRYTDRYTDEWIEKRASGCQHANPFSVKFNV